MLVSFPYSASPRGRCLIDERRLVSDLGFVEVRVRHDIVRSNLAISGYHSATVFQIVTTESWSFVGTVVQLNALPAISCCPPTKSSRIRPTSLRKSPFDRFLLLVYFEALFSRHFFPRKQTTPTDSIKISESCSTTTICQRNRAYLPLQNRRVYRSTRR